MTDFHAHGRAADAWGIAQKVPPPVPFPAAGGGWRGCTGGAYGILAKLVPAMLKAGSGNPGRYWIPPYQVRGRLVTPGMTNCLRHRSSCIERDVPAKCVAALHAAVSCQVRWWKLTQLLYQGCQEAGRSTGDSRGRCRINEL